jgi:hypothetical protein
LTLIEEDEFSVLADEGKSIAKRIEAATRPGLLDAIKLASPYLLDEPDVATVQETIDDIKSLTGLGALRKPLQDYLEWILKAETLFTKKRCLSKKRAKRFIKLKKEFDRFLNKKITGDVFVLRIKMLFMIHQ